MYAAASKDCKFHYRCWLNFEWSCLKLESGKIKFLELKIPEKATQQTITADYATGSNKHEAYHYCFSVESEQ